MSTLKRSTTTPAEFNNAQGERTQRYMGTFIGIVKENRDATTMGRLKVWIPELTSLADDASSWILVQYASPFAGSTPFKSTGNDIKDFTQTQTSYGMWFVPPDVDTEVLVTFVNGDASKGIWFACLYNNFMNQMVPGDAVVEEGLHYGPETTTDDGTLPVGDYNRNKVEGRALKRPDSERKPINPYKAGPARDQGLLFDNARGPNSSSARRESPSQVFGISTPGPLDETTPDTQPYKSNAGAGPVSKGHRMGGSSLVFDDKPASEHVTIKTRSGAQIKIAESDGFIYLNNTDGSAWLELSPSGHVDVYGAKSISMRSEQDVNIRADRDINMEAGRNVNIRAAKDYLSNEDIVEFLAAYANTQQKTIANLFTDAQKKDYVKDFKDVQQQYSQNKLDLNKAFATALARAGFDIKAVNPNLRFTPEQEAVSRTTLSSVDLLHVIRGSHNVGQSFGKGGDVSIFAFNDIQSIARNEAKLSTYDGNVEILAGRETKITSGSSASLVSGGDMFVTAGHQMNLASGSDLKQLIGGAHLLNILNDWSMTVRGDINVRHEGSSVKFEGVPTTFVGSSRVEIGGHNIQVKAGAVSSEVESNSSKVTGAHTLEATSVDVKSSGGITTTGGTIETKSTGSHTIEGQTTTIHGTTANLYGTTTLRIRSPNIDSQESAAPGPTASDATSSGSVSPGTSQVERANTGTVATFARTSDILYSKSNVLPRLARDGNKEYAITYHRQEIETIVRRFITHEPCVEHEVTGGAEIRIPAYQNHLKFRILD